MTAVDTGRLLNVNVQGFVVSVPVWNKHPLFTVIPGALHGAGYSGSPPDNWELRDGQGRLLKLDTLISSWDFPDDACLYLNRLTGIGA